MFLSPLFSGLHSLPEKRKSTSPETVVTLILSWDKEARQGPSNKRRFVLCRALGGRLPRGMAGLRTVAGEQGFPVSTGTKCKKKLIKWRQIWGGGKFFLFSSLWHTEQVRDERCGESGVGKPEIRNHDGRNSWPLPVPSYSFPGDLF